MEPTRILKVLAETEDNLLTCPICLSSFDHPKVLVCLHTFCLSCLSKHQVTSGLMMEERMLMTIAEQERRTWHGIQEQLPQHEEPLAEPLGEPQEPSSYEGAEYHMHRQVDNEGQQQQQQQQQIQRQQQRQQQHQQHQQQHQQQQQQFICCPICRELTALPDSGLFGLRNDFRLESFSKALEAIRLQCTFPQLSQDCRNGHHNSTRSPSAQITLLDHSTSSTSHHKHQRKISRLERICEVDERPRSRVPSTKARKSTWNCIVGSFNKCLCSCSAFDENFSEVLSGK